MESEMASINNILGIPPESNKAGNAKESRKAGSGAGKEAKVSESKVSSTSSDKAEISSVGRELLTLKMQAANYSQEVKQAKTISENEIEAIKERIASNYYFDPEVIDKVVDKLVALPNYK
jgi:hypothetical protein